MSLSVDECLKAGERWIPEQIGGELRSLVEVLVEHRPHHVVEIGVRRGGTAAIWFAVSTGLVVGVDKPGSMFNERRHVELEALYPRFRSVLGNSHELSTLTQVARVLGGDSVDFVFFDGDHRYDGLQADWNLYMTLLRPGGLAAVHDIADTPMMHALGADGRPTSEGWKFWAELVGEKQTFYEGGAWGGIGLWRKPA